MEEELSKYICGNSNIRNLSEDDKKNGRSNRCSIEDPCNSCLIKLGRIKLKELSKKN